MMNDDGCPRCASTRVRRGGNRIWGVYLLLIALAVPAVVVFHLNGGIVAAIVIVGIVLAHVIFGEQVCLDCGHQWRR